MKTNLAYIDDMFIHATNAVANGFTPSGETRMRLVAGFRVSDISGLLKYKDLANTYIEKRKRLAAKLAGLGLTPIAMLPPKAWARLCAESGLYQLQPDHEGIINFKHGMGRAFSHCATIINTVLLSGLTTIPAAVYMYLNGFDILSSLFITFLTTLVVVFLAMSPAGAIPEKSHRSFAGLSAWVYDKIAPQKWRVARMYKYITNMPEGGRQATRATLVLPKPPADVAKIIVIAADAFRLCVAIEPSAFHTNETLPQILRKELDARTEERYRHSLWADPIIYVEQDGVVAILAQFGPFPIEKAVVDQVAKSDVLF